MEDQDRGFYQKYQIAKADGSPVNPNAQYFVLRLDEEGDPEHVRASRESTRYYAHRIRDHIPQLSRDLLEILDALEGRMDEAGEVDFVGKLGEILNAYRNITEEDRLFLLDMVSVFAGLQRRVDILEMLFNRVLEDTESAVHFKTHKDAAFVLAMAYRENSEAFNFLQQAVRFRFEEGDEWYTVTVQRFDGKTPSELLEIAREEIQILKEENARLTGNLET